MLSARMCFSIWRRYVPGWSDTTGRRTGLRLGGSSCRSPAVRHADTARHAIRSPGCVKAAPHGSTLPVDHGGRAALNNGPRLARGEAPALPDMLTFQGLLSRIRSPRCGSLCPFCPRTTPISVTLTLSVCHPDRSINSRRPRRLSRSSFRLIRDGRAGVLVFDHLTGDQ